MQCYTTFNNILSISWRSVLLVQETGVPKKATNPSQVIDKLYRAWVWFELTTLLMKDTACIGSYKSNYHTITTMTALQNDNNETSFKMKNRKKIPQCCNKNETEKSLTETKSIPLTHTHDFSHSWIGTGTSIKSGSINLVYGSKMMLIMIITGWVHAIW